MNHEALLLLTGTAGDGVAFADEVARVLADAGHIEAAWFLRGYADSAAGLDFDKPVGCCDAVDGYLQGYAAAPHNATVPA